VLIPSVINVTVVPLVCKVYASVQYEDDVSRKQSPLWPWQVLTRKIDFALFNIMFRDVSLPG
jgi:hypothetical protein